LKANAIYQQLTHRTSITANSVPKRLTLIASTVSTFLLSAVVFYAMSQPFSVIRFYIPLMGMASIVLIGPAIALLTATLLTSRHAELEHLMLVQLTSLSPKEIVQGYIDAASYHLRVLRAIAMALVISGVISSSLYIGLAANQCLADYCTVTAAILYLLAGLMILSIMISILLAVGISCSELAVNVGVWIGLTWHRAALAVAVSILGILVPIVTGVGVLFGMLFSGASPILGCPTFILTMLIVLGSILLTPGVRRRTEGSIERARITSNG
jgi:hypothetical protein